MRILIVDDQADARDELVEMLSRLGQGHQIEEAADGAAGLAAMRRRAPDLIFLDMNMPVMDGSAFLQAYAQMKSPSALVVLSAYDDFGYMQDAVRYKADQYLMKPLHAAELIDVLEMAAQRRAADGAPGLPELGGFLGELLHEYLTGANMLVNLERLFRHARRDFQPGDEFYVVLCPQERAGALRELCKAGAAAYFDYPVSAMRVFLVRAADAEVARLLPEEWQRICGVSQRARGYGALPAAYRQAQEGYLSGARSGEAKEATACEELARRLYRAIVRGAPGEAAAETAAALRGPLFDSARPLRTAQTAARAALFALLRAFDEGFGPVLTDRQLDRYGVLARFEAALGAGESVFEVKVALSNAFEDLRCQFAGAGGEARTDFVVQYILRYIERNYAKPLSVARISNELSMNYSYVSNLFSKKMGVGLTAYINRYRLQRACERLLESGDKVYEIGSAVGFYDDKHFVKVFKKEYGVTPTEFRKARASETAGTGPKH